MYKLRHYLDMMMDRHRMGPLDAAIRKVVRAGDVVLDLGAGTGVLTFIALDAGAEHVYALDSSPTIEVARRIARANGLADRVTFIQADARTVAAPRQVDGIVADIRGTLPLLGDNVDLFEVVRDRWLRSGGYTMPLADEILVAPVAASRAYHVVDGWRSPRREARYAAAADVAANTFLRTELESGDLLAEGQPLGEIRYQGKNPRKLATRATFVMERPGVLNGLGLWFRGLLAPGIQFDTSPRSPPTIYSQAFLPLAEPRPVSAGQTIEVALSVHRTLPEPIWTWSVDVPGQQKIGQQIGQKIVQSTLKGALFGLADVGRFAGDQPPSLSEEGRMARHLLGAVDGRTSARELAEGLMASFPGRFGSFDEALPIVTKLLGRYGRP